MSVAFRPRSTMPRAARLLALLIARYSSMVSAATDSWHQWQAMASRVWQSISRPHCRQTASSGSGLNSRNDGLFEVHLRREYAPNLEMILAPNRPGCKLSQVLGKASTKTTKSIKSPGPGTVGYETLEKFSGCVKLTHSSVTRPKKRPWGA